MSRRSPSPRRRSVSPRNGGPSRARSPRPSPFNTLPYETLSEIGRYLPYQALSQMSMTGRPGYALREATREYVAGPSARRIQTQFRRINDFRNFVRELQGPKPEPIEILGRTVSEKPTRGNNVNIHNMNSIVHRPTGFFASTDIGKYIPELIRPVNEEDRTSRRAIMQYADRLHQYYTQPSRQVPEFFRTHTGKRIARSILEKYITQYLTGPANEFNLEDTLHFLYNLNQEENNLPFDFIHTILQIYLDETLTNQEAFDKIMEEVIYPYLEEEGYDKIYWSKDLFGPHLPPIFPTPYDNKDIKANKANRDFNIKELTKTGYGPYQVRRSEINMANQPEDE